MTIEEANRLIKGNSYNYKNKGGKYLKKGIYDGLILDTKCGMCVRFIIGTNSKVVFLLLEPIEDTTIIEDETQNRHQTERDRELL